MNQDQSLPPLKPVGISSFSPVYGLLLLIWTAVILFLEIPAISELDPIIKILAFSPPVILTILVVLTKPEEGFFLWAIGLTLLVTQTGFQINVGTITTSALELLIIFLSALLIFLRNRGKVFPDLSLKLPGWRVFLLFFLFSLAMLIIGILRGDDFLLAIFELKGFLIYPLMAFLLVIGIRNLSQMRILILITIIWYSIIAARGLLEYRAGIGTSTELEVFRTGGSYAPVNLYGITLAATIIFTLSISFANKNILVKFAGITASIWMFLGLLASASRAAVISFSMGLLVLFWTNRKKNILWIGFLIIILLAFILFPELTINRIFQFSDSSTLTREYYLESGLAALKRFWVIGAGWGKGFWLDPIHGLYPSNFIPWYHNDYLNIAVQIGIFGLLIYLGYWFTVLREGYRFLLREIDTEIRPYTHGFLSALACLLTAALFEHVLWRPDIAGLVGWVLGMLFATIYIQRHPENVEKWENPSPL